MRADGVVVEPGSIPVIHIDWGKGERERVDTVGFPWHERGQKVTVLFTTASPGCPSVIRAAVAGDHPFVAMGCFIAALASVCAAGACWARTSRCPASAPDQDAIWGLIQSAGTAEKLVSSFFERTIDEK
jgi:hypothetical protein